MKILRHKSDDVSLVTERDERLRDQVEFTRVMGKSLTTLDFIALVVLTMSLPVWSAGLLTDEDNPHEKVDK